MKTPLVLALAGAASIFSGARRAGRDGAKAFHGNDAPTAEKRFDEAARRDPADPLWKLDRGTARLKTGNAAAEEDLKQAARSKDARVASDALYQLGTSALEKKDFGASARDLRASLALDPSRRDAKRNLEIALANLAAAPPPPPSRGKPDPSKKDQQKPKEQKQPSGGGNEFEKNAGMTKEQAEAMLRALDNEQKQGERVDDRRQGRDW